MPMDSMGKAVSSSAPCKSSKGGNDFLGVFASNPSTTYLGDLCRMFSAVVPQEGFIGDI
eukprot:CAMPEP_0194295082 /NCGR_PEP_ID=MMETSP0169-20130528/52574_1 /TAXON_ID=218684 /ORGANISM="Corethron pennatum, Strain L29A3" /LENGTH=58 /DNA_ID=CAMNT_0039044181 /DNA_START=91 /DNA_END=264 /DNA_ORIENTATION=+